MAGSRPYGGCATHWGAGVNLHWRGDVGIAPYIPSELHTIQRGGLKLSGFGRLVAAPTGGVPFNGERRNRQGSGGWQPPLLGTRRNLFAKL